jgi:hypothetical protein
LPLFNKFLLFSSHILCSFHNGALQHGKASAVLGSITFEVLATATAADTSAIIAAEAAVDYLVRQRDTPEATAAEAAASEEVLRMTQTAAEAVTSAENSRAVAELAAWAVRII